MSRTVRRERREKRLTHKRIIGTLTGPIERRVLLWIASHTPGWVTPDLLTWLGVGSAVLISLCYLFAARYPVLLWVACFGFMLNWLFDSMDGTLARYRQIERPRYGYFIDHSMDAFSLALIFFSLGTTLYVRFEIAAVALAGYLLLEIHSALSTYTSQEFKLSYAYLGPTEMRLLAILSSIWVYFNGARFISLLFLQVSFFELILLGLIVLFYAAYILSTAGELVHLARLEPAAPHQVITRKPVGPKIKTEGEKVSRAGN